MTFNEHAFEERAKSLSLSHSGEALFWLVNLETIRCDEILDAQACLDENTLFRAHRFIFPEDQSRAIITHAILRCKLAQQLNLKPNLIKLLYNEFGKPYVTGNPVYFNISHTKDYALIAIHPRLEIGVDIEKIQDRHDLLETIKLFLDPSEYFLAHSLEMWFSLWCAKEAYLKMKGTGFTAKRLPILQQIYGSRLGFVNSGRPQSYSGLGDHEGDDIASISPTSDRPKIGGYDGPQNSHNLSRSRIPQSDSDYEIFSAEDSPSMCIMATLTNIKLPSA